MPFHLDAEIAPQDKVLRDPLRGHYLIRTEPPPKQMVEAGLKGSVVNMASPAGPRGEALVAHYCASKAAVISYTQSAALATAPHGIRVNGIAPGVIDRPMWAGVDALFAKYEGL